MPASAQDAAQATYRDIEQTLGSVPSFFKMFPEVGVAMHGANSSRSSSIPRPRSVEDQEPIVLAVAAQIRANIACISIPRRNNGATDEEIREAVAMAVIARH
jgi:alkylhydroperoxidase/carboxymuconolactone decarboxylase family protein YurZ